MSYILDALKRAEAERSRGEIPDLHAQPLGDLPAAEAAAPGRGRAALLAGGAAILLLGGTGGWWLSRDGASTPAVEVRSGSTSAVGVASPVAVNPPAALPAVTTVQMPGASAAVASTPAPAPTITLAPTSTSDADVAAAPAPTVLSRAKGAGTAASSATRAGALANAGPSAADAVAATSSNVMGGSPSTGGSAAPSPPAASPNATTSSNANANANATEERVVALRDLPEDVRASLPPLTVAGATYSENPASRMLIINGKLVHEGDKLTPELTLQQIRLRTAILSYRGTRFSISY